MEISAGEMARKVLAEMAVMIPRLSNNLKRVQKSLETWDFKEIGQRITALDGDIRKLTGDWEILQQKVNECIRSQRDFLRSGAYPQMFEDALRDAGLSFQGEFPNYELLPFKLTVNIEDETVRLSLGRKTEKTTALYPQHVATWVAARYKELVERKFDAQRFCRDLLEAYKFANRLAYGKNEVLWGHAVSLNTLYDILTVSQASKRDYPKALYIFNLARLKEQFEIRYQNYTFEFGFARNQSHALLLVDSKGRESRVSSLTIYKEAGDLDENRGEGSGELESGQTAPKP